MICKEQTIVYKTAYQGHKKGEIIKTVVTPQGTAVTTVKDGKTVSESYTDESGDTQQTTYSYSDDDLLHNVYTRTTSKGKTRTESSTYTYDYNNRVTKISTRQNNEVVGEQNYTYNDLDFLETETTVDGLTYVYHYAQYPELAEILLDSVYRESASTNSIL